jgi:hypothetical protein
MGRHRIVDDKRKGSWARVWEDCRDLKEGGQIP